MPALLLHRKQLPLLMRYFVVLTSLSLLVCVFWLALHAKQARLKEASLASQSLAAALAQHARDTFKAIDTALLGLAERLEVDALNAPQMRRLERLMQQRVEELPGLQGFFAFDQQGNALLSSYPLHMLTDNAANREYFKWHLKNDGQVVHIGAPIQGKISKQWVVPVSRRLNDENGYFSGVVMASVRVDYFQEIYRSLGLDYRGVISLSLADGDLLVKQPDDGGTDNGVALPVGENNGSFSVSEAGGERLYSYQRLTRYPLTVITALSQNDVLDNWRTETLLQAVVVTLLIVLFNLFGFYLVRLAGQEVITRTALQQAQERLTEQSKQLEKQALEDELTGLANRRHFMASLHEEALRACRNRQVLSLLLIDVDFFKQYNDLNGHAAGDECLRKVAQTIRQVPKRAGDLAARYGGEEFCVLLSCATDSQGALKVAQRIQDELEKLAIAHRGSPLGVLTLSIGIHSLYPQPYKAKEAGEILLQCADTALYQAKEGGRNRVVIYQDEH